MNPADYLDLIRNAKVYDVAVRSPLEPAINLSERLNNRILMKREDLQPVFSFKLRGEITLGMMHGLQSMLVDQIHLDAAIFNPFCLL